MIAAAAAPPLDPPRYLLARGAAELERLQLQARVWEPHAEAMLDAIGVGSGWRCADLGCGAMGILGPLARRVRPEGRVYGLDTDPDLLAAARRFVHDRDFTNVRSRQQDAYATDFADGSLDLAHARFVFSPCGRDGQLLDEMIRITRPGGVVAAQEPDAASWSFYPHLREFELLKSAILTAFARGGGDFNAGRRTRDLFAGAGLRDVRVRAAVVALDQLHPYKRLPVMFARSLRQRILDRRILGADALDRLIDACERHAADPASVMISFTLTQVWGRKPGGSRSSSVPVC